MHSVPRVDHGVAVAVAYQYTQRNKDIPGIGSLDHIDVLSQRGQLERIKIGIRKVAITMRSLKRLVGEEVA